MSPSRPIPDLCLIAVFKQLTPRTQLNAGQMSNRCYLLVRAANRRVKALVITDSNQKFDFFNYFSLSSHHRSIYELKAAGESFPDYPSTRLSKWNGLRVEHLQQLSKTDIKHIVNAFSAVTDLKVGTKSCSQTENLIALLQNSQWTTQLTSLMLFADHESVLEKQQACRLSTVINALTALENLAIHWSQFNARGFLDLPILAQLKKVAVQLGDSDKQFFVSSLNAHAVRNEHLQVQLLAHGGHREDFRPLNQTFSSRIVRYRIPTGSHDNYPVYTLDNVCVLCNHFPALISLEIVFARPLQIGPLFTALSELPQLAHLLLGIGFSGVNEELLPPPCKLTAQLTSVRALDMYWCGSHAQLKWLNLQWTLPNLKVMVLQVFGCKSCDVYLPNFNKKNEAAEKKELLTARQCFQTTLSILHPGVHRERILITNNFKSSKLSHSLAFNPIIMPPRRPIPDLDLISVFKQLTPNSQLNASKMSPRCLGLVRAANRKKKVLAFNSDDQDDFASFSLASKYFSVQLLAENPGEPAAFPDYPVTRLSKWNSLDLFDDNLNALTPSNIEHVIGSFSAVTDLIVKTKSSFQTENLIALLQHPQWKAQLTSLMFLTVTWGVSSKQCVLRLTTAINGLSSLQSLAIPKKIAVLLGNAHTQSFVNVLNVYAASSSDLQVHVPTSDISSYLYKLNKAAQQKIVRYEKSQFNYKYDDALKLCSQFPSLISLSITEIIPSQVGPLFTALAKLCKLAHLQLCVDFRNCTELLPRHRGVQLSL
ncbi:hypothetical protein TYRP_005699, partial [Tyrophagus putrescentiae]